MTNPPRQERRRHDRYETDVKIDFHVNFNIETKIDYRVRKKDGSDVSGTYSAVGRNVSVEGLCFHSVQELRQGDILFLDVHVPLTKSPVTMEGTVRWCRPLQDTGKTKVGFETGIKIDKVNGEDVVKSIIEDKVYNVRWSILLESVFGSFKNSVLKLKKQ